MLTFAAFTFSRLLNSDARIFLLSFLFNFLISQAKIGSIKSPFCSVQNSLLHFLQPFQKIAHFIKERFGFDTFFFSLSECFLLV